MPSDPRIEHLKWKQNRLQGNSFYFHMFRLLIFICGVLVWMRPIGSAVGYAYAPPPYGSALKSELGWMFNERQPKKKLYLHENICQFLKQRLLLFVRVGRYRGNFAQRWAERQQIGVPGRCTTMFNAKPAEWQSWKQKRLQHLSTTAMITIYNKK